MATTQPRATRERLFSGAAPCSSGSPAPSVCLCILCGQCSAEIQSNLPTNLVPQEKLGNVVESSLLHSSY